MNGVLVAFFEISITARLKPFRRLRLAALGFFLAAVGFGMIGLVMHWAWFLLTVLVFTAGEILASPQQMSFIADWAPPEARGRYLSLYQATWSVAFAVNPAITLPLHAALGERAFWGLMPIVAMPGVLVLLRLDRTADRPERLRGVWGVGCPPRFRKAPPRHQRRHRPQSWKAPGEGGFRSVTLSPGRGSRIGRHGPSPAEKRRNESCRDAARRRRGIRSRVLGTHSARRALGARLGHGARGTGMAGAGCRSIPTSEICLPP